MKYVDNVIEKTANAEITPGHLVEYMSTAGRIRVHSTADGPAAKMWALENELLGESIDTVYDALDPVQVWRSIPGEEIYALLANGQSVAIGAELASNGDGTLKARGDSAGDEPNSIVAIALEAIDMSDSDLADPSGRIKVQSL